MYERIERLREDLERARKRRAEAEARVRLCESRLKDAENNQIIAEVNARKLRPEQVAQLLALASDGSWMLFYLARRLRLLQTKAKRNLR